MVRGYHYIYGDFGVAALYISDYELEDEEEIPENDDEPIGDTIRGGAIITGIYYIHTDHLGSYCALTDSGKQVVQRNIFDPWGNYYYNKKVVISVDEPNALEDTTRGLGQQSLYHFDLTRRGFTGHEHYPELKIINMNARLYDPVIGRFFSPDNYVVDNQHTQDFNRYSYARNNPLMYTDPTGNLYNPIFDWEGTFLGTDDRGLKGEAIIMNKNDFKQNMSHNDALRLGTLRSQLPMIINADILSKIDNKVASFPSRPDWDGHLTKAEADAWWLGKSGDPLYVDQSKIDLPGITTKSFDNINENFIYKNFIWNLSNTGKVYGTLKLTLIDANLGTVHIGGRKYMDKYDFGMDSRPLRNAATWIGRPGGANDGVDFLIYGYGNATVPVVLPHKKKN